MHCPLSLVHYNGIYSEESTGRDFFAQYITTVTHYMILLFRLAVLRKWRTKYGPTATYGNLAKCFYQADMQSMVQTICQALGAPGT